MTDEQIKEFISLKPQFVKYIYTCLKGATFFHPNDLINEAFIKLSNQKYPILNIKTAGLFYIKNTFLEEMRRSSKKPLLKEVFKSKSLENFLNSELTSGNKAEEDQYEGNILVYSNYDFNKISKILNSYSDEKAKNIVWLKYQGLSYLEIAKEKKESQLPVKEYEYKLKQLKLHISKNLDLDYHKIERIKIKESNKKKYNYRKRVNPVIVKTINTITKEKKYNKQLKMKLIFELKEQNLNNNQIAKKLNITRSTVGQYLKNGNNKTN
jgi:DNA-directed RNA polymerase specialized sigma24 family protein